MAQLTRRKVETFGLHDSRWSTGVEKLKLNSKKSEKSGEREPAEEEEYYDPFKELLEATVTRCTTCGCPLDDEDRESLMAHYKSPWHRHNARRVVQNRTVLSEEDFEERAGGEEDVSSLSEESDDEEEELQLGSSQVYFLHNDKVYSIYRCILSHGQTEVTQKTFMLPLDCAIFLLAGGHFAAAIFRNDRMICHKAFHRYVIRAKQGGAQSVNDNAKGPARSAGAQLRRYNERALADDIEGVLKAWTSDLQIIPLIFIRCASYQKAIFHGENGIQRGDKRLRTIPFETKRPLVEEVQRTWDRMKVVFDHGPKDQFLAEAARRRETMRLRTVMQRKKKEAERMSIPDEDDEEEKKDEGKIKKRDHIKPIIEVVKEEEVDRWPSVDATYRRELYAAVRDDDAGRLAGLMEHREDRDKIMEYLSQHQFKSDGSRYLHLAAQRGLEKVLEFLLEQGCEPFLKNDDEKVPYQMSMNKTIKQVFIKFREENPTKYIWTQCHIPEPVQLTEEQLNKLAEKKKDKKHRQKERQKEKKEIEKKENEEKAAKEAYLALSDREKRALAAEARMAAQQPTAIPRCFMCAMSLPSVPFEYSNNKFCSPGCVAVHRRQNQANIGPA